MSEKTSGQLPAHEPVARVVIVKMADGRKAKVIRAMDERTGTPGTWIVDAPEGTLLYAAPQAAIGAPAEALRHAGAMLSNCAFNLAQRAGETLTERDAKSLDECRRAWDDAARSVSTGESIK